MTVLSELVEAIAKGEAEGHDNDGLNAATLEVLYAEPDASLVAVERLLTTTNDRTSPIVMWLRQFAHELRAKQGRD